MSKPTDYTGRRFGRLVAIRNTGKQNIHGRFIWEFRCDCGNLYYGAPSVLHGTRSCGCLRWETYYAHDPKYINEARPKRGEIDGTVVACLSDKVPTDNKTGVRGVSYNKAMHRFEAYINFKKQRYHLGYFDTIEEASKVRKDAEQELWGNFKEWYSREVLKNEEVT